MAGYNEFGGERSRKFMTVPATSHWRLSSTQPAVAAAPFLGASFERSNGGGMYHQPVQGNTLPMQMATARRQPTQLRAAAAAAAFEAPAAAARPRFLWWLDDRAQEARFAWNLALAIPAFFLIMNTIMPGAAQALDILGVPAAAWAGYQHQLTVRPFVANAFTSGVIYTLGDILSQRAESGDKDLDKKRTLRNGLAGFFGHGPMGTLWYKISQSVYLKWGLMQSWSVIPKVAIDQLFYCPIWVSVYLMLIGLMSQEEPKKIVSEIKTKVPTIVKVSLKLWPAVHCVTYGILNGPLMKYRILWCDSIEIIWVAIMANKANKNKGGDAAVSPA